VARRAVRLVVLLALVVRVAGDVGAGVDDARADRARVAAAGVRDQLVEAAAVRVVALVGARVAVVGAGLRLALIPDAGVALRADHAARRRVRVVRVGKAAADARARLRDGRVAGLRLRVARVLRAGVAVLAVGVAEAATGDDLAHVAPGVAERTLLDAVA